MADEFELDLDQLDEDINKKNKVQERIVDLSSKVKTASEERDAARAEAEEAKARATSLEKEKEFYSSFSDMTSKYSAASEYKDTILEKVKAGYTVEDATIAVLAKEGKFQTEAPQPEREIAAGGSAVNAMPTGGEKPMEELSRDEKRAKLMEMEAKGELVSR